MSKINYTPGDLKDHDAVAAVIKDSDGKVLMFKHKKFGFWTIPVGKAEPGETPYQGMCTELKEECDIKVTKASEIGVKPCIYERDGKDVHINLHVFVVETFEGSVINKEPHKHLEMKYMTIQEIKKIDYQSDATQIYLESIS